MIPRRRLLRTTVGWGPWQPVVPGCTARSDPAARLGLRLILAASGIGLGPAAAYLPELFARRHRCTGAGSACALAAAVGGALPPVLARIVQASLGSVAVGAMLSVPGLLGVVCGLRLTETRHRSLRGATLPVLAGG